MDDDFGGLAETLRPDAHLFWRYKIRKTYVRITYKYYLLKNQK